MITPGLGGSIYFRKNLGMAVVVEDFGHSEKGLMDAWEQGSARMHTKVVYVQTIVNKKYKTG